MTAFKVYMGIAALYMIWGHYVLFDEIEGRPNQFISYSALVLTGLLWPLVILMSVFRRKG